MFSQSLDEVPFPEFLSGIVICLGYAVDVKREHVSWEEFAFSEGAIPLLEETQECAG